MAEKLRIGTVLKHLRARHAFALHVSSGVIFVRERDRWRALTLPDRVSLLEDIQRAHAGTVTGYYFSMSELEWCICTLADGRRFRDLPLFASDGGGDPKSNSGSTFGEVER